MATLDEGDVEDEEAWMDELDTIFSEVEVKSDMYLDDLDKAKISEEKLAEKEKLDLEESDKKVAEKEKIRLKRNQEESMFQKFADRINTIVGETYEENEEMKHVKSNIDDLLEKLEGCLGRCKEVHPEYIFTVRDETQKEIESAWFTKILDDFHKTRDEGVMFSSRITKAGSKSEVSKVSLNKLKLRKIDFESFDGDIRRYPRFKEQFIKHIKPQYDEGEEAFVLRSFLTSDIKDEVENVGEAIWKRLDDKYGRVSQLVDAIMADIKTMSKCADNNPTETIEFILYSLIFWK